MTFPKSARTCSGWADENVVRGRRGSGAVQVRGFTDPFLMQSAVRGAEG
ncbi:hypothetical protein [Streptomyces erythrochromogenes]|nr:hypothetical protein OG364_00145 [Streptomyces erythrochromogenes]WST98496.1 hypothetical protein OG364_41390 [Streptomyces erythrochromogenes]